MGHDEDIGAFVPICCCISPFAVLFMAIPNLAISIASFVVARDNPTNVCDGSTITLPKWLLVNASILATLTLVILLILGLFLAEYWGCLCGKVKRIVFAYAALAVTNLYTLYLLAWTIVGSIALFRDSPGCDGQPIGRMTLTNLIWQWITLGFNVIFICVLVMSIRKAK